MIKKIPNPIDVHVGGRVRSCRNLAGISQGNLGEQLGLSFQQIQKYEKAASRIGASRLFQIAQIFDVPVQFFFDDMAEIKKPPAGRFAEVDTAPFVMDLVTKGAVSSSANRPASPELKALANPQLDLKKLPFDPLEYVEHLDELPFERAMDPYFGQ